MNEELKPCPFCGYTEIEMESRDGTEYYYKFRAYCPKCGTKQPWEHYEAVAASNWNGRAEK